VSGGKYKPVTGHSSGFNLARKSDGSVIAWGENDAYQLGDGTNESRTTPVPVTALGTGVVALAAGSDHSLALKSDGSVLGWGLNQDGQVGGGGFGSIYTQPVQVVGLGAGSGVVAIAAGARHSLALKSDGTVLAWGNGNVGQIGDGGIDNRYTPTPVYGIGPGSGTTAISAGSFHNLALRSDGTVLAWGYNISGQVGNGQTSTRVTTPEPVVGLGVNSGVTGLAAGQDHSMVVKGDGSVLSWGSNLYGQLGDGTNDQRTAPGPTALVAGSGVSRLVAGDVHSLALKSDGSLLSWGYNGSGQLGDGTTVNRAVPGKVLGLVGVTAVSGGAHHTVALGTPTQAAAVVPSSGPPDTVVNVSGAHFSTDEPITVVYKTQLTAPAPTKVTLCIVNAVGAEGRFGCLARIPSRAEAGPLGRHTIQAKGQTSGLIAKTFFTLT
jgi:alpha-tubulin suppressor-like RCC1 family protein